MFFMFSLYFWLWQIKPLGISQFSCNFTKDFHGTSATCWPLLEKSNSLPLPMYGQVRWDELWQVHGWRVDVCWIWFQKRGNSCQTDTLWCGAFFPSHIKPPQSSCSVLKNRNKQWVYFKMCSPYFYFQRVLAVEILYPSDFRRTGRKIQFWVCKMQFILIYSLLYYLFVLQLQTYFCSPLRIRKRGKKTTKPLVFERL